MPFSIFAFLYFLSNCAHTESVYITWQSLPRKKNFLKKRQYGLVIIIIIIIPSLLPLFYVPKCKINLTFKLEIIRGKFQTELSLCHKLWFFNPCIISIRCCRRLIFQTINSVRSNSLSLKYQRLTPSGYRDLRIKKFKWRKLNSF